MDTKTSKTISIIAASIVLIAFFIPWFDSSTSAWDVIVFLFKMLSKAKELPDEIGIYLPILLISFPICSAIIIINNAKTLNESEDTTKSPKIITIIVFVLVVIALIYVQSKNPFADFMNIFDRLAIGFYLTLIASIYYIVDMIIVKTETQETNDSSTQTELFCSNCGKKYNSNDAGEFCEECGSKL